MGSVQSHSCLSVSLLRCNHAEGLLPGLSGISVMVPHDMYLGVSASQVSPFDKME